MLSVVLIQMMQLLFLTFSPTPLIVIAMQNIMILLFLKVASVVFEGLRTFINSAHDLSDLALLFLGRSS